jgi:hypothetical protein
MAGLNFGVPLGVAYLFFVGFMAHGGRGMIVEEGLNNTFSYHNTLHQPLRSVGPYLYNQHLTPGSAKPYYTGEASTARRCWRRAV